MTRGMERKRWMAASLVPLMFGFVAARGIASRIDVQPDSKLWVAGTSSVRAWQCRATAFEMTVEGAAANAVGAVLGGEKAISGVELKVPAERLECGNGSMNGHMRKAIKAQEFPQIAFRLSSYELERVTDSVAVELVGTLTIGGAEKPVTIKATATAAPEGSMLVAGTYAFKLSEYGLKAPTLMLGTLKVHDLVKVNFEMLLKDRVE